MFFSFASSSSSSRTFEWKEEIFCENVILVAKKIENRIPNQWKNHDGDQNRVAAVEAAYCSIAVLKEKFLANFWHDWKANFSFLLYLLGH